MPKFNAVDAISPAIQLAKVNLFQPFRWSFWWGVALLGLATGEVSSGGGCNFNFPAHFPHPQKSGGQDGLGFLGAPPFPHIDPHVFWTLLPVLLIGGFILMIAFMYVSSVCRFILLEAVLNGQIRIREAWGRWKDQGARFFGFQLVMMLIFFAIMGAIVLLFVMMVGLSTLRGSGPPHPNVAAMLGGLLMLLLAFFVVIVPYLIVFIMAKDFAVPVMALEGTTFGEAWRKVWGMAKDEVGSVAGYFGMKIVLTIAAGIIFGIIGLIALVIILLPVGGLGFLVVLAGKGAGLTWNLYTIALAVAIGLIALFLILCVHALISVPVAMFFPAYALYFFAGRYKPLHDRLFPPPPPAPVVTPTSPPDLPPEPITS